MSEAIAVPFNEKMVKRACKFSGFIVAALALQKRPANQDQLKAMSKIASERGLLLAAMLAEVPDDELPSDEDFAEASLLDAREILDTVLGSASVN
jgi:hypothetical protein